MKSSSANSSSPSPPAELGKAGRDLWESIMVEHRITDSAALSILATVCATHDDAAAYAGTIAREGAVIEGKGGPRDHPLVKPLLASRAFVVRGLARLAQLRLDREPKRLGRPPRPISGVSWEQLEPWRDDDNAGGA